MSGDTCDRTCACLHAYKSPPRAKITRASISTVQSHILLEGLSRRYTFLVDLNFIGSFIHETLTSNVYLGILRGY